MISPGNAGMVATRNGRQEPARHWRSILGWSATSAPVALLLITGIAVGPRGINLLPVSALPFLSPVVPVALAALGVLVGLGLGDRRSVDQRILGAATVEAAITMVVVSVGMGLLAWTRLTLVEPAWTFAVASSICAATSLTLPSGASLEPRSQATRIIEAGVLLPIVTGGVVLAWLRAGTLAATLTLLGQAFGVTLALSTAGWLVLTRASSPTEERVFAISALLLIGGAADALALSALLGGLTAGIFWQYVGGRPRDTISRDVLFVQHPLLVVVLLVAGARAEVSLVSITLGVLYAALRTVGTIAASTVAAHVTGLRTRDVADRLIRPGVFGVAFALNAAGIVDGEASFLLATVVVGTIGSEFAALLLPSRPRDQ